MKTFLDQDFLLQTDTARRLYHDFAKEMPIIDYHNHLAPQEIAENKRFGNLTQIWLNGDHYKWRAMRTNGVNEHFITGQAADFEKFMAWAETVPYTLRNPLYHWTHLELKNTFGIEQILNPDTAKEIYENCTEQLQTTLSVKNLLQKAKVEVLCTTDDPTDTLEFHSPPSGVGGLWTGALLPTFRPDKAMAADNPKALKQYILKLESVVNTSIHTFEDYLKALKSRHDFFASKGCKLSDHGLEQIYAEDYTEQETEAIFQKILTEKDLMPIEVLKFRSAMLIQFGIWNHEKGWTQQFHLGALRNNNSRMLAQLGTDTGWDSIGDFSQARALSRFLDKLDTDNQLAKTIIYNLNPSDNELIATMIGNFNDGSIAGKIQFGSAWWFLDQKDGMERQINALSNMGLLSRFVGMLTDSRSFLSFPRHEYFRRILCNLLGNEIENGELPNDIPWTGKIIQDICYHNAKKYFEF
jgi:glucuronate isomerase